MQRMYEEPKLEIVNFEAEDIITTSSSNGGSSGSGNEGSKSSSKEVYDHFGDIF